MAHSNISNSEMRSREGPAHYRGQSLDPAEGFCLFRLYLSGSCTHTLRAEFLKGCATAQTFDDFAQHFKILNPKLILVKKKYIYICMF